MGPQQSADDPAAVAAAAWPSPPGGEFRQSGFANGGAWDTARPSADLAAVLQAVSGPGWRCPGATHDELLGLLRQWQALESWAAAGKLGLLRALIREEARQSPTGVPGGDLADGWSKSLVHEAALALAMPPQSMDRLIATAWDLEARLPQVGALLANGDLSFAKARVVAEALAQLSDEDAAKAEALIAPDLPGKTFGQSERLAVQAAITIDPDSAARRREEAERNRARVTLRRDPSGAASLAGYDLPTDETLAAHANVCARAAQYRDSGAFPGVRMDQFRAKAYLDLMNGVTGEARIASGQPPSGLGAPSEYGPDSSSGGGGTGCSPDEDRRDSSSGGGGTGCSPDEDRRDSSSGGGGTGGSPDEDRRDSSSGGGGTGCSPDEDRPDSSSGGGGTGGSPDEDRRDSSSSEYGPDCPPGDAPESQPPGEHGPNSQPPGRGHPGLGRGALAGSGDIATSDGLGGKGRGELPGNRDAREVAAAAADAPSPRSLPSPPPLADLVIPLRTLCGLGDRPGEGHRLGPLDPDLCRSLAAGAVGSPYTTLCVTVTDPDGIAIGHGCARPDVRGRLRAGRSTIGSAWPAGYPPGPLADLPARVNLTIPAACLPQLAHAHEPEEHAHRGGWSFAYAAVPGPPGGYGAWTLTASGGQVFVVKLESVPAFACDHRHESRAYQPNNSLRHLVQVRDYECTFPTCSRHARESDFEHAVPYDRGGRTCGCNAGARSRRCHQVKQSPGWNVTQPRPGWHQWTTPAGRDYVQGPKRYPA